MDGRECSHEVNQIDVERYGSCVVSSKVVLMRFLFPELSL